ncbi:hypothetical protein ACNQVK_28125 [Mycobacterium sp. 134]|uniref:hypothetical protein n=1 Tax=Mycobacterium sp. 134 TaxID=3400425 RepID=UPI003AAB21D7
MTVCPHGHLNPVQQPFCGDCGAPVGAPVPDRPGATARGRWATDPFARHQYRFWDGTAWSVHVADNTALGTDPPPRAGGTTTERLLGVAAGVVTAVLLAGAISAIVTGFSGTSDPASSVRTTTVTAAPTEPPQPQSVPGSPPPDAAPWPVAVIGASCRPHSNNAVTNDGSVAYCVTVAGTDAYLWSLYPNSIEAFDGENPSVAVCQEQTGRSQPECDEYLTRPSDPGDGQPVVP